MHTLPLIVTGSVPLAIFTELARNKLTPLPVITLLLLAVLPMLNVSRPESKLAEMAPPIDSRSPPPLMVTVSLAKPVAKITLPLMRPPLVASPVMLMVSAPLRELMLRKPGMAKPPAAPRLRLMLIVSAALLEIIVMLPRTLYGPAD